MGDLAGYVNDTSLLTILRENGIVGLNVEDASDVWYFDERLTNRSEDEE